MAIYANPDVEAKRLDRIMSKLPIDSDGPLVDGKPERLPKQLSRHLLPKKADKTAQENLDLSIRDVFSRRKSRDRKRAEKARKSSPDSGFGSSTSSPSKNRDRDTSYNDGSPDSSSRRKEEKKAPAKSVRFTNKDRDNDGTQSTRPSKEGAGRPYNLSNITLPPTARGQERSPSTKSPRHGSTDSSSPAEPYATSSPPPPSVSLLDLHSGRDRSEKDDKYYRYSSKAEDVTPRRMPNGSGDDAPRSRRRRSVVLTQDKPPSRHHSRRESAADYAGHQYK